MCSFLTRRTFVHKIDDKYDLESEVKIYLSFLLTDVIK